MACVLGYWSYLLGGQDNHAGALDLLRDAASLVRGSAAATQSWIAARQAEEAAALRHGDAALHALDQAMTVFDYASPRTERAWTAFFSASRLGGMTIRAYSQLNHPETDTMARSLLGSLLPTETKVRAIVLADLAHGSAVHGDVFGEGEPESGGGEGFVEFVGGAEGRIGQGGDPQTGAHGQVEPVGHAPGRCPLRSVVGLGVLEQAVVDEQCAVLGDGQGEGQVGGGVGAHDVLAELPDASNGSRSWLLPRDTSLTHPQWVTGWRDGQGWLYVFAATPSAIPLAPRIVAFPREALADLPASSKPAHSELSGRAAVFPLPVFGA